MGQLAGGLTTPCGGSIIDAETEREVRSANRAFRILLFSVAWRRPPPALSQEHVHTARALPAFESSFARFEALPPAPEPAGHVVDLETFEPPVEAMPAARPIGGGVASYYGRRFHGRQTAIGERFDMHAMTAAHRTLPFGTLVEVTNPVTGKRVTVRINDRGPFRRARDRREPRGRDRARADLAAVTGMGLAVLDQ